MNRGCRSDSDVTKCGDTGNLCTFCSSADGCNSQSQYSPSSLSCIQCSGTEECEWGFAGTKATPCQQLVSYGKNQSCYTVATSTSVTRGCRIDRDVDSCTGAQCVHCIDDGCNSQNVVTQTCQSCQSDVSGQAMCSEEDVVGFERLCSTANEIVEYENRGCFTKRQSKNIINPIITLQ